MLLSIKKLFIFRDVTFWLRSDMDVAFGLASIYEASLTLIKLFNGFDYIF